MPRLSPRLLLEIIVNFVLPWAAYRLAAPSWGESGGLIASALPPIVWSLWELWHARKVDALSLMVVAGIALSLLVMLLGGDARMLLMRESLVSGLIGLVFLGSLCFGKPLVFYLARATLERESSAGRTRFDTLWGQEIFRRGLRRMTCLWGVGLVAETAIRAWMAWNMPADRFLVLSPIVSYGFVGMLVGGTLLMRRALRGRVSS